MPLFAAELERADPVPAVWQALFFVRVAQVPGGLGLLLRALRHPECPWSGAWSSSVAMRPNDYVEEILATAEHLAGADRDDGRRAALASYVRACEQNWDRAVLAQRLRLFGLGYGQVDVWIHEHGRAEDLDTVLDHLGVFLLASGSPITRWLQRQSIPAARWRTFADHAEHSEAKGPDGANARHQDVLMATYYATKTFHPDAMTWVVQFAPTSLAAYEGAAAAFGNAVSVPAAAHAAVAALLAADVAADGPIPDAAAATGQSDGRARVDQVRMGLVQVVAKHGIDEAGAALLRAYQLLAEPRGFLSALRFETGRSFALSGETVAKVVDGVLEGGQPEAFREAQGLLSSKTPPAVYAVLCRHALSAPSTDPNGNPLRANMVASLLQRQSIDRQAAEKLLVAALTHADRELGVHAATAAGALGRLPSAEVVAASLERLRGGADPHALRILGASGRPDVAEHIRPWLRDDDPAVRSAAAQALSEVEGAGSIDTLQPLFDDPHQAVRLRLCQIAKTHLDRRFVPGLLKLLRDPEDGVRKAAQEALEATEFYVTQTERWQRLLRGTGLEANSAAEALLAQAKAGNDKRVRLAAIRGLGTLGVKETLPFLIQMMQDTDAEVVAAASAAVAALNK
jgi:HEAT repeat protein